MRKHFPQCMVTGRNNFGESEVMWFKMLESISKVSSFMLTASFPVHIGMQTESRPSSPKIPSLWPPGGSEHIENRRHLRSALKKGKLPGREKAHGGFCDWNLSTIIGWGRLERIQVSAREDSRFLQEAPRAPCICMKLPQPYRSP